MLNKTFHRAKRTDRRLPDCEETFVCLLLFPSLLEVSIGPELPIECSKMMCSAKVKIGMVLAGSEIDDRSYRHLLYCETELDLAKGKNRLKATYPHSKKKNEGIDLHRHTDPNSREYGLESRSKADVPSVEGLPPIDDVQYKSYWCRAATSLHAADHAAVPSCAV